MSDSKATTAQKATDAAAAAEKQESKDQAAADVEQKKRTVEKQQRLDKIKKARTGPKGPVTHTVDSIMAGGPALAAEKAARRAAGKKAG